MRAAVRSAPGDEWLPPTGFPWFSVCLNPLPALVFTFLPVGLVIPGSLIASHSISSSVGHTSLPRTVYHTVTGHTAASTVCSHPLAGVQILRGAEPGEGVLRAAEEERGRTSESHGHQSVYRGVEGPEGNRLNLCVFGSVGWLGSEFWGAAGELWVLGCHE